MSPFRSPFRLPACKSRRRSPLISWSGFAGKSTNWSKRRKQRRKRRVHCPSHAGWQARQWAVASRGPRAGRSPTPGTTKSTWSAPLRRRTAYSRSADRCESTVPQRTTDYMQFGSPESPASCRRSTSRSSLEKRTPTASRENRRLITMPSTTFDNSSRPFRQAHCSCRLIGHTHSESARRFVTSSSSVCCSIRSSTSR